MDALNRHDRRAQATRVRLAEKNRAKIIVYSLWLFVQTRMGKLSRKAARRRLEADARLRFGRFKAELMAPRLPPATPAQVQP